ncbi:hypothetical protein VTK73DRAFT_5349 [Phialemonium thermophilum]|uniref:Uncharacterized protein n=1 Tax=Phialemonium thermophilum TaxID=223376 RepID=A0ABR3Y7D2_9PEZI
MLRRHTTKSRTGLQRHKSTCSVRGVPVAHLGTTASCRDAQIAACHALNLAEKRAGTDTSVCRPLPAFCPQRVERKGDDDIREEQSVRFVGSFSLNHKVIDESTNKRDMNGTQEAGVKCEHHGYAARATGGCGSLIEPAPSSIQRPPHAANPSRTAQDYVQELLLEDNDGAEEGLVPSAPSSYRRLRRSKSMLTAGGTALASHLGHSRAPFATTRLGYDKENFRPCQPLTLRTTKSMSFLKFRRREKCISHNIKANQAASPTESGCHGSGSGGRDTHLVHENPRTQLDLKAQFSLKRSLRRSSSTSPSLQFGVQCPFATVSRENKFRAKAREASKILKINLRNLFNFLKDEDGKIVPEQHIRSLKTRALYQPLGTSQSQISSWDRHTTSSLYAITPMVRTNLSGDGPYSKPSSALTENAVRKASDEKSMVTSWADSGANTLTNRQQKAWIDYSNQNQMLSGQELYGLEPFGSSTMQGFGARQSSLDSENEPSSAVTYVVNSKRMYSALMKRFPAPIDAGNERIQQDCAKDTHSHTEFLDLEGDFWQVPAVGTSLSSASFEFETGFPAKNKYNQTAGASNKTFNEAPVPNLTIDGQENRDERVPSSSRDLVSKTITESRMARDKDYRRSEPHQNVLTNKTSVSSVTSSLSGSPDTHLFRTNTPYRQALQKSMQAAGAAVRKDSPASVSDFSETGTQIRRVVSYDSDALSYSDSVYSCSTSEEESKQRRNSTGRAGVSEAGHAETAANVVGAMGSTEQLSVNQVPGNRVASSVASVDWKMLLSTNLAKLKPASSTTRMEVQFTLPNTPGCGSLGHVRERRQVEDSDTNNEAWVSPLPSHQDSDLPTMLGTVARANALSASMIQQSIEVVGHSEPDPVTRLNELCVPSAPQRPGYFSNGSSACDYVGADCMDGLRSCQRHGTSTEDKELRNPPAFNHYYSINQSHATKKSMGSPQRNRSPGAELRTRSIGNARDRSDLKTAVEKLFGKSHRDVEWPEDNKENEAVCEKYYAGDGYRTPEAAVSKHPIKTRACMDAPRATTSILSSTRRGLPNLDETEAFI